MATEGRRLINPRSPVQTGRLPFPPADVAAILPVGVKDRCDVRCVATKARPGRAFCLNCGTGLAAAAPAKTPAAAPGLPAFCPSCRGENPPGMKFCRNCGTSLASTGASPQYPPPSPGFVNMPPPGPLASLTPNPRPGEAPPPPTLPPDGSFVRAQAAPSTSLPPTAPTMMAPVPANGSPLPAMRRRYHRRSPGRRSRRSRRCPCRTAKEVPPTLMPNSAGAAAIAAAARPPAPAGSIACPRCGSATPIGFVYCQACGLHIQAVAPTDPGGAAARPPIGTPAPIPAPLPAGPDRAGSGTDGARERRSQAATLAADPRAASAARPPAASHGVAWGTAVLVNRDGTDGDRHTLDAEYTVIGGASAGHRVRRGSFPRAPPRSARARRRRRRAGVADRHVERRVSQDRRAGRAHGRHDHPRRPRGVALRARRCRGAQRHAAHPARRRAVWLAAARALGPTVADLAVRRPSRHSPPRGRRDRARPRER